MREKSYERILMMHRIPAIQKYFVIEGNIGSGKTTLLRIIRERLGIPIVFEPVHRWQTIGGTENLLEKFYNDTPRWAYTFQSYAFITRILEQERHARAQNHPMQILERSVFSDRYCFAQNCYEQGAMSSLEWNMYQDWFSWLVDEHLQRPSGFIYLSCDAELCYKRLKKRNRSEEVTVTPDYLQLLEDKHRSWLIDKKGVADYLKDTPVLILDGTIEFEKDFSVQEQWMAQLSSFIGINQGIRPASRPPVSLTTL
jgi:deoxyadenosine/deoxycytidine kinase